MKIGEEYINQVLVTQKLKVETPNEWFNLIFKEQIKE